MEQAAGRGPRLVQSWPAPLQNERLSPRPWGGGTAGVGGRLYTSRRADTPLTGTWVGQQGLRGPWSWQGGGGVMRPRGCVIRLVVERKMTAPRTEERQVPVGQQPLIPLGVQ